MSARTATQGFTRRRLTYFLRGLVFLAPVGITAYICVVVFRAIDGWLGLPIPGAGFAVSLALITLFLMALKMGSLAHGPEYATREIVWVWQQLPLWSIVGGLVGLGLGLLVAGKRAI